MDSSRLRHPVVLNATAGLVLLLSLSGAGCGDGQESAKSSPPPDILFILMDDVGIDQMTAFGWGGDDPASTPNINLIARASVKFSNVWSMPECSPARSTMFTGRWPLRTGVQSALVENMLPQDEVSPYEATLPRVLRNAGYASAMVGKYHLGNFNNPSGNCSPSTRGWDYFSGNLGADPPSIDMQGGLTAAPAPLACGFNQSADPGACYFAGNTCRTEPNGKACLEAGGVFVVHTGCESPTPGDVDFSRDNGYYVWPKVTTKGALPPESAPGQCISDGSSDCVPGNDLACTSTTRQYMTVDQTDGAVDWWNGQKTPHMLTVSYNAMHTPYQQPSSALLFQPGLDQTTCDPTDDADSRLLANSMLEAMDVAIGRLLNDLHLATLNSDGLITSLHLGNTLLVIAGDNGTYGQVVKTPFDLARSKGTVYQTGVWVPMMVAGALVKSPGRTVDALVNEADFFELFADVAGVDVHDPNVVPPSHILDSQPMLAYLTNPAQPPIRKFSFTQLGIGFFETPVNAPAPASCVPNRSWPCVPGTQCVEGLIGNQARCLDNAGTWYGPPDSCADSADPCDPACPAQFTNCCEYVNSPNPTNETRTISPIQQYAVRNRDFKLVRLQLEDCSAPIDPSTPPSQRPFPWAEYGTKTVIEFYSLQPTAENPAGIDRSQDNLLKDCQGATPSECCQPNPAACLPAALQPIFNELSGEMTRVLNSEPACPGDGNLDKVVNQLDLDGVQAFMGSNPSFFDFNLDGQTDNLDRNIVLQNLGTHCLAPSH